MQCLFRVATTAASDTACVDKEIVPITQKSSRVEPVGKRDLVVATGAR